MSTATDLTAIVRDLNSRNCARIRRLEAEVQKNGLEIKRLRDLVRGLVAILDTITLEDHEIALLDEARKAIKEGEP